MGIWLMTASRRELRALHIVAEKGVTEIGDGLFAVVSRSDPGKRYIVRIADGKRMCECMDFAKGKKCKHIYAVTYYLMIRDLRAGLRNTTEEEVRCKFCGSENINKAGFRYNKTGIVQRYYCKDCHRWFRDPIGFDHCRFKPEVIATALDLYCRGLSLRQISDHLESAYGIEVSYGTIYLWLKKYVELVRSYTSEFTGNFSERWHADETLLNVSGRDLVLWNLLDNETRFLIACHVSARKSEEEAENLIKKGLQKSNSPPWEVITDGNPAYTEALRKEASPGKPLIHVVGPLAGPVTNNRVERLNQTIKRRAKGTTHFNKKEGVETFVNAFGIFYNFIRSHSALNYATPAEKAGIIKKTNWHELIMSAKRAQRGKTGSRTTVAVVKSQRA
jgi:putative transposase